MVDVGRVNNANAPPQCLSRFAGLWYLAGQRLISGRLLVQGASFPSVAERWGSQPENAMVSELGR